MEWYSVVEGIIILVAIIVVGVIQNGTIKAQEKELKAIRTYMEIFDVQKVKDFVDLSTETLNKKAEKSETELDKLADELEGKSKELEISYENMDDAFKAIGGFNENIVELCNSFIDIIDIGENINKMKEGKEKLKIIQTTSRRTRKIKTSLSRIKESAQDVVNYEKEEIEKSSS